MTLFLGEHDHVHVYVRGPECSVHLSILQVVLPAYLHVRLVGLPPTMPVSWASRVCAQCVLRWGAQLSRCRATSRNRGKIVLMMYTYLIPVYYTSFYQIKSKYPNTNPIEPTSNVMPSLDSDCSFVCRSKTQSKTIVPRLDGRL